jgi:CheY-like chemotaxis protein
VPVVAVTAHAHAEDRERAIAGGFDDYLAKPIDPAALVIAVATVAAVNER